MEAVRLFENARVPVDWEYDGDADTLYLSFGKPRPAVGIDVGDGVIVRFDESAREVVGLTIVGVGHRLEEYIGQARPGGGTPSRKPKRRA